MKYQQVKIIDMKKVLTKAFMLLLWAGIIVLSVKIYFIPLTIFAIGRVNGVIFNG
jgi:hypothetical protein